MYTNDFENVREFGACSINLQKVSKLKVEVHDLVSDQSQELLFLTQIANLHVSKRIQLILLLKRLSKRTISGTRDIQLMFITIHFGGHGGGGLRMADIII